MRCNGDHLRSACPKPRQQWEEDFEKPDFWTRKVPSSKQVRVQLDRSLNLPCPAVLHVRCSAGLCLVDTCSDALQRVEDPVVISHLGGDSYLGEAGSFVLESDRIAPVTLSRVFAVEGSSLPAGVVALLGVADIQFLGLSLDAMVANPGDHWDTYFVRGSGRTLTDLWNCVLSCCPRRASKTMLQARTPRAEPPRALAIDAGFNVPPLGVPRFLAELQAKARLEREARTANRIGRLFMQRPPKPKRHAPPPSTPAAPSPVAETLEDIYMLRAATVDRRPVLGSSGYMYTVHYVAST